MLLRPIAVIFLLLMPVQAIACINTYGTDLHGHGVTASDELDAPAKRLRDRQINREYWQRTKTELVEGLDGSDFKQRSDYAAALIYLGEYDRAVEILLRVEEDQPNEYIVASNLGTAYELLGNNEQALNWIKKGLERNPGAHGQSEWLHVKNLEAKLAMAENPDWLSEHSVLGIDFTVGDKPKTPRIHIIGTSGSPLDLDDIESALEYQLSERVKFVAAPDPTVANLLFDYANIMALTGAVEQATPLYELAAEYGCPDKELLSRRIEAMKQIAATNSRSGQSTNGSWPSLETVGFFVRVIVGAAIVGSIAICFVAVVIYRRRGLAGQSGRESETG